MDHSLCSQIPHRPIPMPTTNPNQMSHKSLCISLIKPRTISGNTSKRSSSIPNREIISNLHDLDAVWVDSLLSTDVFLHLRHWQLDGC